MAYDPLDPNTWNEPAGNTANQGLISSPDTTIQDMGGYSAEPATQTAQPGSFRTEDQTAQNWFGPTNEPWMMSNQGAAPVIQPETKVDEQKSNLENISTSLSAMLKTHGGEIFAKTMAGSASGVLNFLAARRKARGDAELQDKKFAYETQTKNAQVARASAMPTVGSMVQPGVTGRRQVGNQQTIAPAPQYTGLINAPRV